MLTRHWQRLVSVNRSVNTDIFKMCHISKWSDCKALMSECFQLQQPVDTLTLHTLLAQSDGEPHSAGIKMTWCKRSWAKHSRHGHWNAVRQCSHDSELTRLGFTVHFCKYSLIYLTAVISAFQLWPSVFYWSAIQPPDIYWNSFSTTAALPNSCTESNCTLAHVQCVHTSNVITVSLLFHTVRYS